MYPSTFSHLNTNYEIPTGTVQPAQTRRIESRRHGPRRPRRRFALVLARLAHGGGSAP